MKKQYSSPYLRVVAVKNDIIATSTAQISVGGSGRTKAPWAPGWTEDDDYDY